MILLAILLVFIIILSIPWFIWMWLNSKAKKVNTSSATKAYNIHRAIIYYLNQLGYSPYAYGPKEYASKIDQLFVTEYSVFSSVYQKIKYSRIPLIETEIKMVNEFYKPFITKVNVGIPFKNRLKNFLNISHTVIFLFNPKINSYGRNDSD